MSTKSDNIADNSISNECAKRILNLLKAGEEKIHFGSNQNAILILGNTGSGKTSFAQFIAGDNHRMNSTEVGEYTGEFIISDTEDKISVDSTIVSKTTFPELIVDTETNIAFIDNPGFNDSRNEAYDVAIAYFIKKVFDTVKNVKIVLITSYPSVRKGVNRVDFLQLLEHLTVLLKNIDRYVDSIALVATKVDNTFVMYNGVPGLIPNNGVIENIAKFLVEVKESLILMRDDGNTYTSELKRVENKFFCENAIKIIDALLIKDRFGYARLGIFRRPNQPGPLSQIPILQDGKNALKNMMYRNLRYSPSEGAEIGYTLSDKSKTVVRDLVIEINNSIVADMQFINTNLVTHYRNFERQMFSDDMYALRDHLESASKALSRITSIDESINIAEFVNIMCENFTQMAVHVSKSRLRDIVNLGKFLAFLQNVSAKKYVSFAWKWTKELDEAVQYVNNSRKWYNFLAAMHNRLSQYDVQKNKTSYQIPTFSAVSDKNSLVEDVSEISTFLRAIGENSILESVYYEEIKKVRLDDTKLRFFERLLQVTLCDTLVYKSLLEEQCVVVIGEYILLSEVCINELYNSCKSAQIFAKHTVYVDTSLYKENDISIIANRWEIIGEQTVSLDGEHAQSHKPLTPRGWFITTDHDKPDGSTGEDGEPGLPGSSAGHFFGVGSQFKNIQNLHVTANGGNGSCGKNGSDGADGSVGTTFSFRITNNSCYGGNDKTTETIVEYPGGSGGDAGRGGAGGVGGREGDIITIDLSDKDLFAVLKKANAGSDGEDGKPGEPGEGGKGGSKLLKTTYLTFQGAVSGSIYEIQQASDGSRGHPADDVSKEGRRTPEGKEFLRAPSLIVSDFRNELVKNFSDCIKKRASWLFFKEIQGNVQLRGYYDTNTLSSEWRHIEKYHHEIPLDIKVMLYNSVLETVSQIVESKTVEYNSLNCLHLATTSKLLRLQAEPWNRVTSELLGSFQQRVETPILPTAANKVSLISTSLDLLLENNLIPAIENLDAELIELSYPECEEAEDSVQKLQNLLSKRKSFSTLLSVARFMRFLCEIAAIHWQIVDKIHVTQVLPFIKFNLVEIPTKVWQQLQNATLPFQADVLYTLNALNSLISTERKTCEKYVDVKNDIVKNLLHIERDIESAMYNSMKSFSADETVKKTLDSVSAIISDNSNSDEMESIKRIETRVKLIDFDDQFYLRVNRESNIERLVEALSTKNCLIQQKTLHNSLITEIIHILRTVQANITLPCDLDKIFEVSTLSLVLDFTNSFRLRLQPIAKEFENYAEEQSIIDDINEIGKLLHDEYEKITFSDVEIRLFQYWRWVDILGGDEEIAELMRKDFLLFEYDRIVDAFKRSIFPFNILNPDAFAIPPLPDNVADQSPDELKKSLEDNLETLQTTLNTLQKNPFDGYISQDHFIAIQNYEQVFQWKNTSYAKKIADLLRGREIVLTSSVCPTSERQLLRFDSLRLRFNTLDKTQQKSLDEVLRNFDIRMVHSGGSAQTFCGNVYSFNEESCEYRCKKYSKVHTEQPRSPYTMWMISLQPSNEDVTFHALRPFFDQPVDLHLEGDVKYFKIKDQPAIREKLEMATMNADYTQLMDYNNVGSKFVEPSDDQSSASDVKDSKDTNEISELPITSLT